MTDVARKLRDASEGGRYGYISALLNEGASEIERLELAIRNLVTAVDGDDGSNASVMRLQSARNAAISPLTPNRQEPTA